MHRISVVAAILLLLTSIPLTAAAADISQVMTEYNANPAAFKDKYFGKTISVTGPVSAVYSDYVSLGDARLFVVNCTVADPAQIRKLSPGMQVTATGTVYNMLAGTGV